MTYIDPAPDKLRETAILAEACLGIDAARGYGLLEGGPEINPDRCQEVIELAHAAGHTWTVDEVRQAALALICQIEADAARLN